MFFAHLVHLQGTTKGDSDGPPSEEAASSSPSYTAAAKARGGSSESALLIGFHHGCFDTQSIKEFVEAWSDACGSLDDTGFRTGDGSPPSTAVFGGRSVH